MSLAFRTIRVYFKLGVVGAIIVCTALVVLFNWNKEADVWFFHTFEKINVLYLILVTAIASISSFWIINRVRGVVHDVRALKKERRDAQTLAEQRKLAADMADREKRIDEKLNRSLRDGS